MAREPRVRHPLFARLYPHMARALDRGGIAEHRATLLAGLTGEVIEVGAGTGSNFAHYPPGVTRVLAVEPEPRLREIATTAAATAPVPVEVVDGVAERLPAAGASAAAVVCSLVLCSVRDQAQALGEIRRVLHPDGELRLLEHVRADTPGMVRLQWIMDHTFWPLVAGGCRCGRDTNAAVEQAGFTVRRLDRFLFAGVRTPTTSFILATATAA